MVNYDTKLDDQICNVIIYNALQLMYQTPVPVLERMCTYNVILYRNIYDSPVSMQIIYWGVGSTFQRNVCQQYYILYAGG